MERTHPATAARYFYRERSAKSSLFGSAYGGGSWLYACFQLIAENINNLYEFDYGQGSGAFFRTAIVNRI